MNLFLLIWKQIHLNCIVLGDDVNPSDAEWDIFIKEIRKEMTVKAGQKCTAIRRIFVPENKMEDVWQSLETIFITNSYRQSIEMKK